MRIRAAAHKGFDFGSAWRCAGIVAAVLYLAVVQMLSAAHAASGEANVPGHHSTECILCLTAHGAGHGLPTGEIEAPVPPPSFIVLAPTTMRALAPARVRAAAPRGPPSF